jgi:hypothetical protein
MYIWPLGGDAISWPTMCTHSGSSRGQRNGETVITTTVRNGSVAVIVAES